MRPMAHPTEWRVNVTQVKSADGRALDGADADELSAGEIEGRRQALAFFEFLKREAPGFADAYIVDIPPQLGIRETRRVARPLSAQRRRRRSAARAFPTPSASTAGRSRRMWRATCVWRWPDIPGSRGFNHLPYRMLVPLGIAQPAGRRPLRLDDP